MGMNQGFILLQRIQKGYPVLPCINPPILKLLALLFKFLKYGAHPRSHSMGTDVVSAGEAQRNQGSLRSPNPAPWSYDSSTEKGPILSTRKLQDVQECSVAELMPGM